MRTYFGLAMIAWGLLILFVLPETAKLLNYVIMGTYALAVIWWAGHDSPADVSYWIFAFGITATVTWGYAR